MTFQDLERNILAETRYPGGFSAGSLHVPYAPPTLARDLLVARLRPISREPGRLRRRCLQDRRGGSASGQDSTFGLSSGAAGSRILAREFPGALVADASARWLAPHDGRLFVVHPRRGALDLPGLRIEPRKGTGPLPTDHAMPEGIYFSSDARGLLDNLAEPSERLLAREDLERWIEQLASRRDGIEYLNHVRDEARSIAASIRRRTAFEHLELAIRATLATGPAKSLRTRSLQSRAAGKPIDELRLARVEALARNLEGLAPGPAPRLSRARRATSAPTLLRGLLLQLHRGHRVHARRSGDDRVRAAHPAAAPRGRARRLLDYRLVTDPSWMARTPASPEEFVDLVLERHEILMAARPDNDPGRFGRTMSTRAGRRSRPGLPSRGHSCAPSPRAGGSRTLRSRGVRALPDRGGPSLRRRQRPVGADGDECRTLGGERGPDRHPDGLPQRLPVRSCGGHRRRIRSDDPHPQLREALDRRDGLLVATSRRGSTRAHECPRQPDRRDPGRDQTHPAVEARLNRRRARIIPPARRHRRQCLVPDRVGYLWPCLQSMARPRLFPLRE